MNLGKQDYQATQHGTVWNSQGIGIQAGTINGNLNTANTNGLDVSRNDYYNINIKVPVFSSSGLKQLKDNFSWAENQIFSTKNTESVEIILPSIDKSPKKVDTDSFKVKVNLNDSIDNLDSVDLSISNLSDFNLNEDKQDSNDKISFKLSRSAKKGISNNSIFADNSSEDKSEVYSGWADACMEKYSSAAEWSSASMDSLIHVLKDVRLDYTKVGFQSLEEADSILKAPLFDDLAAEAGNDIGKGMSKAEKALGEEFLSTSKRLSKFSLFAKGAMFGLSAIDKIIDVVEVDKSQRVREAFVRGCELYGEVEGAGLGILAVGSLGVPSGLTSLLVAPPVAIGASASGGYFFKTYCEKTYVASANLIIIGNKHGFYILFYNAF